MSLSPFDLMQRAVDIVEDSAHPTNKVAAALHAIDSFGQEHSIARTNYAPKALKNNFETGEKIGNASATIHAETACLIEARATNNAAMFVTDLPCPNCVKNMAEAGVKTLYIDHKGFKKDYAIRRSEHFKNMSLRICEKAGISVFKIFRKDERLEPILKIKPGYSPAIENPPRITTIHKSPNAELFSTLIDKEIIFYKDIPFALALSKSQHSRYVLISARSHPVIGYTSHTLENSKNKYSFLLQPLGRIIMAASRYYLRIDPHYVFSSCTPTSRELVNMLGANLQTLIIADQSKSRDEFGPKALKQLMDKKVIRARNL